MTVSSIRSQIGRLGAWAQHANNDLHETTRAGRAKFLSRFEDEVDPQRLLTAEERSRRALAARKLYFGRLALKSAQARRRKAKLDQAGVNGGVKP